MTGGNARSYGPGASNAAFQRARVTTSGKASASSVFTSHRVRVPQYCSSWYEELRDRLDELTSLAIGWDGYMGQPVSFQCAQYAAGMLEHLCRHNVPAPSLIPGSDGSLQVEWHRNNFDVELDIVAPQRVYATRFNRESLKEEELEIENDFTAIAAWVEDLADREIDNSRVAV